MSKNPLFPYLRRFGRRLRLRDGLDLAQRSLGAALQATLVVLLAGRLWPIENLARWALLPVGLWLAATVGYTLFRPLPPLRVARRVDAELRLKERLSTSLALQGGASPLPQGVLESFRPELVHRLHADALRAAQTIQPAKDFPLRANRRALALAGAALVVSLALLWLPNPMDDVLRERQAVQREAERQAQQVEQLREEIANASEMTPEEREELLRKLDELARQLRENPGSREEALADLSKMEEALRQQIDPRAGQRQAMLEALAAQLEALAQKESSPSGDLEGAAEAIQELAEKMEAMTPEEREALAQQLAQMAARAAQAGDSQLAQSLAAMAQAAQNGEMQAAQEAARQAAENLEKAQGEAANQRALSRSLSQVQSSRQAVANSGRQGQQTAQSGPGNRPSQNGQGQNGQNGQGQGQGQQGQGQNGQGAQPGGGGGTTANNLPGGNRTGQAADPQGEARPGGTGELDSQVYVPRERGGQGDGELSVPGQDTDQGETTSTEQRDPLGGANNPALVPYQSVYQSYLDTASQAIDESYIPPGLKDYVKNYFSQLEP